MGSRLSAATTATEIVVGLDGSASKVAAPQRQMRKTWRQRGRPVYRVRCKRSVGASAAPTVALRRATWLATNTVHMDIDDSCETFSSWPASVGTPLSAGVLTPYRLGAQ